MLGIMCLNQCSNLRRELINIKEGSICCICWEHGKIEDAYATRAPAHRHTIWPSRFEGWHIQSQHQMTRLDDVHYT